MSEKKIRIVSASYDSLNGIKFNWHNFVIRHILAGVDDVFTTVNSEKIRFTNKFLKIGRRISYSMEKMFCDCQWKKQVM